MLEKIDYRKVTTVPGPHQVPVMETAEEMPWDEAPAAAHATADEMLAGLDTAETRRFKGVYWAFYRLLRRDTRNNWYKSLLQVIESGDVNLPTYTKFNQVGEGIFDSELFKEKFYSAFGTPDQPKATVEELLRNAAKLWPEARTERSMLEWAKEDYKRFQNSQKKSPLGGLADMV
jgi:hypothetical protein